MARRLAFADESNTHGNPRCYGIGILSLRERRMPEFQKLMRSLRTKHGVTGEQKWSLIANSHGRINYALDLLETFVTEVEYRVDIIIVNTALYNLWNAEDPDRESAFYRTYTYLVKHVAKQTGDRIRVSIDRRTDRYKKQTEVLEKIANYLLKTTTTARIESVEMNRSDSNDGIQAIDVLTGMITSAHLARLDDRHSPNHGKALVMSRAAHALGWRDLVCDTMPHEQFNIWHFPTEYRSMPATRKVIWRGIKYVTKNDFK